MLTFDKIAQTGARGMRVKGGLRSLKRGLDRLSRVDSPEGRALAEQMRADTLPGVIAKSEALFAEFAAQRRRWQQVLAECRQHLDTLSSTNWTGDRRADALRLTAEVVDLKAKCEAMIAAIDSFVDSDDRHDLNHPRWQGPLRALSTISAE